MRISPEIESLIPYKPGRSIEEIKRQWGVSEVIKLDSNENPLGPSPKALEAIQNYDGSLARYPNPGSPELLGKLSERWEVRIEDIVLGNGSSELIDLVIRVFCEPGDKIITPKKILYVLWYCLPGCTDWKKRNSHRQKFPLGCGSIC